MIPPAFARLRRAGLLERGGAGPAGQPYLLP